MSADADRASTRERILAAALSLFAERGVEATSLDAVASEVGVRKQTLLYWFGSKEQLLFGVVDHAVAELGDELSAAALGAGPTLEARVRAVVDATFRLGSLRPELLAVVREVTRLGPPAATRLTDDLEPLVVRARGFLEAEMAAGHMRRSDPRLVLMSAYSTVIGVATEVEVLRAVGVEPGMKAMVRRRTELLDFLKSALVVPGSEPTST